MERRESITLRNALQEFDVQDEENKIHQAAQNEAADLVWQHRNPRVADAEKVAPYDNPDVRPKNKFAQELVKGVHNRSQSLNTSGSERALPTVTSLRSASDSSSSSNETAKQGAIPQRNPATRFYDQDILSLHAKESRDTSFASRMSTSASSRRRSSGQRKASSGSSKGLFRNPDDQIYEEPQILPNSRPKPQVHFADEPQPLQIRNKNPRSPFERPNTVASPDGKPLNRYEIYKNPPTQSRNAGYMTNTPTPPRSEETTPQPEPLLTEGKEIRSDDIRAATSMRRRDRSPNLPTPTAVSDRPGRPIVSFDRSWRAKDNSSRGSFDQGANSARPPARQPLAIESAPIIPTIILPNDNPSVPTIDLPDGSPSIPTINVTDDGPSVPTINFPDQDPSLPIINVSEEVSHVPSIDVQPADQRPKPPARPLPVPSKTSPLPQGKNSHLPWLNRNSHVSPVPRQGGSTATCANCALPISGRIVTASGSGEQSLKARFHPECFTCFHCSTPLECVAFYPEPDEKRKLRLQAQVEELGLSAVEDLGEAIEKELRFFCHLDFHEFFSPRCKSCKTPIEGQVIIAAGGEYHVGHFFCAECGDPFDSNTPFVEHNGYAYCVRCHTRRTSARCRGCKSNVLEEMTVSALGGSWHENCFKCYECGGGFGDDGRFFIREVEREKTEKEKRTGMLKGSKFEEKPVCIECEGRRLKA
ncbi:MAG: hypothetical protein Q9160_009163 [Pyrenula sp. 1 TL-2023]